MNKHFERIPVKKGKRFIASVLCTALMTSFFPMSASVESEVEKNNGPGWGYYTVKTVLHAAGLAACFFEVRKKELTNFASLALISHGAGFGLPFFYRNMQLLKRGKRDIRFRIGMAMNAWSFGIHLWGINTVCGAWKKWEDADCKIGESERIESRRESIKDVGFGAVLHLIGGFLNEYGSSMMEEKKGLKVTLKMSGFDQRIDQEASLKQEPSKLNQKVKKQK